MADPDHFNMLLRGANAWNNWRRETPLLRPDLNEISLAVSDLRRAGLAVPDLVGVDLSGANLYQATLRGTHLQNANLAGAYVHGADLAGAKLSGANLRKACLSNARLTAAVLVGADLNEADLVGAYLGRTDLAGANLRGANLIAASLLDTNFAGADLSGAKVHGVSAWNLNLSGAVQSDLIITHPTEPTITVDNIEVAQFIYLLINNEKIRDVVDTITSKVVLILGRFTPGRKAVLDALRDELRGRNYLPVLFDFDRPAGRDLTGTVATLAHMARFIIADLTDPSCIPHELASVVPTNVVPVQPIMLSGGQEYAMFSDLRRRYHWVLEVHRYDATDQLLADIKEKIIAPAEDKALELKC